MIPAKLSLSSSNPPLPEKPTLPLVRASPSLGAPLKVLDFVQSQSPDLTCPRLCSLGAHYPARAEYDRARIFPNPGFMFEPALPLPTSFELREWNIRETKEPYPTETK